MAEGEEERGGGVCNLICQGHTLEKEEEQVGGLEVRAGDTKKEQRMERRRRRKRRRKRRRRLWLMQLVPFQSQRRRNSIKEEGAGSSTTFPKPGREWRVLVFVCSFYTERASTMNGRFSGATYGDREDGEGKGIDRGVFLVPPVLGTPNG